MQFPPYLLTETINVLRRGVGVNATSSRDALNNPIYGDPTTWFPIYEGIKVRLAYNGKSITYAPTGELIKPQADLIYDSSLYTIMAMDHIYIVSSPGWPSGVEYVVDAVYTSFYEQGISSHGLAKVLLPIV